MTRDDIIRMAREQGLPETEIEGVFRVNTDDLGRMLAAEREACAKVCDDKVAAEYATGKVDHNEMGWTQACAIAIRARGDALTKLNQAAEANGEEL